MAVYVALSFVMSPGGYLGTDTGAKVATLDVMEQRGTARPGLGYWAEDARSRRRRSTRSTTRVNVDGRLGARHDASDAGARTPALEPRRLPAGAAPADGRGRRARRSRADRWLAGQPGRRRAGGPSGWWGSRHRWRSTPSTSGSTRRGWPASWARWRCWRPSSTAHRYRPEPWVRARCSGVAATMRTEALVYTLVAVACGRLSLLLQRRPLGAAVRLGALADRGLRRSVGRQPRVGGVVWAAPRGATGPRVPPPAGWASSRIEAARRSSRSSRSDPATRPRRCSWAGWPRSPSAGSIVLDRRGEGRAARVVLACAFLLHLSALAGGLGFVPGLLLRRAGGGRCAGRASDPTGSSLRGRRSRWSRSHWCGRSSSSAAPTPQWAGRYALSSCIILVALGVAALQQAGSTIRWGVLALSLLVTMTGVLWLAGAVALVRRSVRDARGPARGRRDRPERLLHPRGGAGVLASACGLTAVAMTDLERAAAVVERAGLETVRRARRGPLCPRPRSGDAVARRDHRAVRRRESLSTCTPMRSDEHAFGGAPFPVAWSRCPIR